LVEIADADAGVEETDHGGGNLRQGTGFAKQRLERDVNFQKQGFPSHPGFVTSFEIPEPPFMKHNSPLDDESRFTGQLRHYHRSGARQQRTWEEWVEGDGAKPGKLRKWLKIAGIVVALLALGGVIAGLVIALR